MFVLSACEETRHDISKALGMEKPDFNEEEVLTGEPLAIPPNFDLRPPGSSGELYYPSADSGAPPAAATYQQPGVIPAQQQPYQEAYPAQGAYPGAYPAQGTYPAQPAYGHAAPQAIPPGAAQNVFAKATQAYSRANVGAVATPSDAYNSGAQPVYPQQPYAEQPEVQDVGDYQGQAQALPQVAKPATTPSKVPEFSECDEVVIDYSGEYVCMD